MTIDKCLVKVLNDDSAVWSSVLIFIEAIICDVFSEGDSMKESVKRLLWHRHGMQTQLESMSFEAVAKESHMTTILNADV